MNTKLTTFTTAQIESMKFADLATEYNNFAVDLGLPTIKKFSDKTKGQARLVAIQAQYVEEAAELQAKAAPAIELTNKEMVALRHIVANALDNMGGKEPADLFEDNFSWFNAEELAEKAVITVNQAKGLIASLTVKGLVGAEESSADSDVNNYLTNEGIKFAEANKEELYKATLSAQPVKAAKTTFDMTATIVTVKDAGKEGTIENSLHAAIASGANTVQEVIDWIMANHKRPRAEQVDQQYVVHNIKWFIRKGHLKIQTN